jgi:hypothetical protein
MLSYGFFNYLVSSCYRNLNSVPALYSLIFVTPQLILDFLVVTENVQLVLGDGIPGLWPLLLKAENIPVKLNFEVKVSIVKCCLIIISLHT